MSVRLRHVARVNPPTPEFDRLDDDSEVAFVPLEAVWPGHGFDATRRRRKADVAVGYTRFREGDILVPKITPTFQADRTVIAHGLDGVVGAGTTELHIVRAGDSAEPRYLRYLLSSKPFLDEGEASMIGVAGQKRVPDDCLRDVRVPVPQVETQRAIADYLDAETGRIDALIERKRRMVALCDERKGAKIDSAFDDGRCIPFRLKHLLRQPPCYGVLVPRFTEIGVPFIRVGDLRGLDVASPSRTIDPVQSLEYSRTLVKAGDVLVSVVGSVDKVAVVPNHAADSNIARAVCRLVPKTGVPPRLLALMLQTTRYLDQARLATGGDTAQPTLNMGDLARFDCRFPSSAAAPELLAELESELRQIDEMRRLLTRQLDLLVEHRQALITAAVTGQLDIPGLTA